MSSFENTFILIAGANASGKSTIIKPKYVVRRVKYYFDPDRFENDPDFLPITDKNILTHNALRYRERDLPDRFAIECIDNLLRPENEHIRKEGFATESNLVSSRDFEKFREAKERGMKTELYFVYIPLKAAIQQEQIRADRGDQRRIGKKRVIERYRGLFNIQTHIDSGNIDVIMIYDNSRGIGEEELVFHMENGNTIYLNPKPILQWFQDAQALNPNIKIPSFLEKKEHITHQGILTAVKEGNGQAFITLENTYGSRKQEFQYEISLEAATAFRAFIRREIEILIENGHVKNAIALIWNQSTNEA